MNTILKAVSYAVPDNKLTDLDLQIQHADWPIDKINKKTGISNRYISASDEFSLELAVRVANKLFIEHEVSVQDIDFVIFCTQTPKYLLPSSSCMLQNILSIPSTAGAIDINQGCSGYIYSLLVADSLLKSGAARKILLINSDTYSKIIAHEDRGLKPLFGDGASASLLESSNNDALGFKHFIFGTDGAGSNHIIAPASGLMGMMSKNKYMPDLYMNGPRVFSFALKTVPNLVDQLLQMAGISINEVDLFIFHQANGYILEHLRDKIGIDKSKFYLTLNEYGNTGSSSIAIGLSKAMEDGLIFSGAKVMLIAFGVGLSWGGLIYQF